MDKQTQAVAEALSALWIEGSTVSLEDASKAAIKASGAEHLGELVRALLRMRNENSDPYGIAKEALSKLPPELRGES
jgi:hypothetical protein